MTGSHRPPHVVTVIADSRLAVIWIAAANEPGRSGGNCGQRTTSKRARTRLGMPRGYAAGGAAGHAATRASEGWYDAINWRTLASVSGHTRRGFSAVMSRTKWGSFSALRPKVTGDIE